MSQLSNPHDKFFKQIVSNAEIAKDFLLNYLPRDILQLINLDGLKISKDSFVDEELQETFSDILYEVSLKQKPAFIYLLFEHKSYTYPQITLQLLKYLIKIWELKFSQKSTTDKLPIIIPIVFYHGKEDWNIGLKLSDILEDIPDELMKYFPEFEYILYDLSQFDDRELVGKDELRLFLVVMKYIFSENFPNKLHEMLILLDNSKTKMYHFDVIIRYVINARKQHSSTELEEVVKEISLERSNEIMTIAEQLRSEGMQKGLIKGIEGMLDIRFGEVGLKLMNKLEDISDINKLEDIKNLLIKTNKIEDVERFLVKHVS